MPTYGGFGSQGGTGFGAVSSAIANANDAIDFNAQSLSNIDESADGKDAMPKWEVNLSGYNMAVINMSSSGAPPADPSDGDAYVLNGAGSGGWAGFSANDLAVYDGSAWRSQAPAEGYLVWDQAQDELMYYSGTAWAIYSSGGEGGSDGLTLDIGTSSTTFPSFAAADGDTSGSVCNYLNTTTTKGEIYYLNSTGPAWTLAQADAPGTSEGLLMLSVGTNSDSNGMMVQGYVRLDSGSYEGTAAIGDVVYLSDVTSGMMTFAQPVTSGEVVRIVGYCLQLDGSNNALIYFNPSPEYSELA